MKLFEWADDKNKKLKSDRGVSFEEVVFCIANGFVLDIIQNPNQTKYPNQRMYIVNIDNYAYLVPFIEREDTIYLIAVIPSRKATKKYLKG